MESIIPISNNILIVLIIIVSIILGIVSIFTKEKEQEPVDWKKVFEVSYITQFIFGGEPSQHNLIFYESGKRRKVLGHVHTAIEGVINQWCSGKITTEMLKDYFGGNND